MGGVLDEPAQRPWQFVLEGTGTMRAFLTSIVAATMAIGGPTVAGLVLPTYEASAQAPKGKAKTFKKPAERRSFVPRTTGFEHQQCSVQNPCSTRNDW
jgi:hypothetical protein